MPDLILASTSPYRRALLERLKIPFRCTAPNVDEADYQRQGFAPAVLAATLALAKARDGARQFPGSVVLGSDQVPEIDGAVLHKPGTAANALQQLQRLSGRTHSLWTAVACIDANGQPHTHLDHTRLTMRSLDAEALYRYLALDEPFDCAGSYKIEQAGISLFDSIETHDFTAITGLPLMKLTGLLQRCGFSLP